MYAYMYVVRSPCFLQDLLRASYAAGGAGGQARLLWDWVVACGVHVLHYILHRVLVASVSIMCRFSLHGSLGVWECGCESGVAFAHPQRCRI